MHNRFRIAYLPKNYFRYTIPDQPQFWNTKSVVLRIVILWNSCERPNKIRKYVILLLKNFLSFLCKASRPWNKLQKKSMIIYDFSHFLWVMKAVTDSLKVRPSTLEKLHLMCYTWEKPSMLQLTIIINTWNRQRQVETSGKRIETNEI